MPQALNCPQGDGPQTLTACQQPPGKGVRDRTMWLTPQVVGTKLSLGRVNLRRASKCCFMAYEDLSGV